MITCVENVGELLAAEISTDACFANSVVAVVAADEIAALATPATLLITPIDVLLNVCVVVQRVAFLYTHTHQHLQWHFSSQATITFTVFVEQVIFPVVRPQIHAGNEITSA